MFLQIIAALGLLGVAGIIIGLLVNLLRKQDSTFSDIQQRLALIDAAQKRMDELSNSVVSLQHILIDKRSRGAFGEVQLNHLIQNMLPSGTYQFQCTLSNLKRADCMLYLPEPSGHIAIDAKFPLESYQALFDDSISNGPQLFRQALKKHIDDIASKYIIPGETSDGAMLFIPAEAIFAEIHSNFQDIIDLAHQKRIWLVSPTTLMAVLTTARAVLKDAQTRQQVHIIQEHLAVLATDFNRFEKRMDNLTRHIQQAHQDVDDVNKSAKKLISRFNKIEKVELEDC